jgi:plastocyanin
MNLAPTGRVHRIDSPAEVSMVPAMRYLLVVAVFFAVSVPALAATQNVNLEDDQFVPDATSVAKNDTVNWHWKGTNDHTVTSNSRQIDRFKSGIKTKGGRFAHEFKYAGRFRYFCEVHPDTMRATVTVGTDDGVAPKITRVRARVSGSRVKLSFRLSERSVLTAKVGRKKVVKTFGAGRHAVRFRRLSDGSHRARLSAKDGFGHIGRKSKRFTTG